MKFTNYIIALTGAFALVNGQADISNLTANNTAGGHSANSGVMLNGIVPSIAGAAVAGALVFFV
ncbi:uncharacterized protein Ecym_7422 [Eremothecium cymbalariae DBVPG|uniref:Uncharacterized protein n=1 Tax=Eremothecium cymbalariae (strain CBS 270.75 / DBVPG 7215 / KCTC 17166 / NRRL Y-17582) TaxID=931890 RepID=G8JWN0_ERECY|nr:hypothetical protein Ecym_7422 [Eremothecium cymbalariae DBVPG\